MINENIQARKEKLYDKIYKDISLRVFQLRNGNINYSPDVEPTRFINEVESIINALRKYKLMPEDKLVAVESKFKVRSLADAKDALEEIYNNVELQV